MAEILELSGIYQIRNLVNGKLYIGSTGGFRERWNTHLRLLRRDSHHSWKLQKDFNVYGEGSFEFSPLIICKEADLAFFEQRILEIFDAVATGYNISSDTEAPMRGRKHSAESKEKISKAGMGNQYTKGNKSRTGQINSEEHREKCSRAQKGRKRDPKLVKKSADALRGKPGTPHTDETKAKLSAIHKVIQSQRIEHPMTGKQHSEATKLKMSLGRKGKPKSEEHKLKIAQSWIRRKALTEVKEINEILISKREEG
jgi:group I intron endonuclease